MKSVLERAKAHFETAAWSRLEVPEWGEPGKPLVITWGPMNSVVRSKIFRADAKGNMPDHTTVAVRAIIHMACDEKRKKLFDGMEEHTLNYEVDATVVLTIGSAIVAGTPVDAEPAVAE